jgi:predicted NBD/HSP70 family sugar kinase
MKEIYVSNSKSKDISVFIPDGWEDCIDDFLAIHVKKEGNDYVGYMKDGVGEYYREVDITRKMQYEIERWIAEIIGKEGECVIGSQALKELDLITRSQGRRKGAGSSRTLRMLSFLQALLIRPDENRSELENNINEIINVVEAFKETLQKVNECYVLRKSDNNEEGSWFVSLSLLTIITVAYSQVEWHRPFLWEAYSSGRVRDELSFRWKKPEESIETLQEKDRILNSIAFLIRFQSDPGQLHRKTGTGMYRDVEIKPEKFIFNKEDLINALLIISLSEKVRGTSLKFDALSQNLKNAFPEIDDILNIFQYFEMSRSSEPWEPIVKDIEEFFNVNFRQGAKLDQKERKDFKYTWSFSREIEKQSENMSEFKKFVENNYDNLGIDIKGSEADKIFAFTFGRRNSYELRNEIVKAIDKIVKSQDMKKEFDKYFRLEKVNVPSWDGESGKTEIIIRILLKDHIAAKGWLDFLRWDTQDSINENANIGESVDKLFEYLFNEASRIFKLEKAENGNTFNYVPFPLIERLLETIYKLRPSECITIPIRYENGITDHVHLPRRLGNEFVSYVAHFVWGKILNHAMDTGFSFCELGSEGLQYKSGEINWKEEIDKAYNDNGYSALIERFLSNYKREKSNINKSSDILSPTFGTKPIKPIAISDLTNQIDKYFYCLCPSVSDNKKNLFIGIDIGGQLIKIQCYEYNLEKKWFKIGELVRINTSIPNKLYNSPDDFAERLINEGIKKLNIDTDRIACVGIDWPGAVRDNRIAGTSRIITYFFGYSFDSDIIKAMELDILNAIKSNNIWNKESPPIFTMINDGDAHALGTIAFDLILTKEPKDFLVSKPGTMLVLIAGTGTAGAMFQDGRLYEIPAEYGKLLLNLGGTKKSNYPEGIVNPYCSMVTLPNLMKKKQKYLELLDPKSHEVGELLDLKDKTLNAKMDNFGKEIIVDDISGSLISRIGTDNDLIKKIGEMRLAKLLNVPAILDFTKTGLSTLGNAMEEARKTAEECVTQFGYYIGDIIAMLWDIHNMENIVLGGGVLKDKTGEIVKVALKERLRLYGLEMGKEDSKLTVNFAGTSNSDHDPATLGSIVFASRELVSSKKIDGISKIRDIIQQMEQDTNLTLDVNYLVYEGKTKLKLADYALSKEEADSYIQECGKNIGLRYTRTEPSGNIIYTRWSEDQVVGAITW